MDLLLDSPQLIILVLGSIVPLITYVINHYAPWISEPVKAIVLVVATACVGACYTALETNVFGFNEATLELVLTAVVGALAAHKLLWNPAKISHILGGGTNRPGQTTFPERVEVERRSVNLPDSDVIEKRGSKRRG